MVTRADIFISHSSKEKPLAEQLGEALLEGPGLHCWIDVWSIPAASDWANEIERALSSCRACVVMLSEAGWGSYHLAEARQAIQRASKEPGFIVIPVLVGNPAESLQQELGNYFRDSQCIFLPSQSLEEAATRIAASLTGEPAFPLGREELTPIRIRRDARLWRAHRDHQNTDRSHLYTGERLNRAVALLTREPGQFDAGTQEFLLVSQQSESASRKRSLILASSASLILLALLVASMWLQSRLEISVQQTRANSVANLAKVIRPSDPTRALAVADVAFQLNPESVSARQALSEAWQGELPYRVLADGGTIRALAVRPDNGQLAFAGYDLPVTFVDADQAVRPVGEPIPHATGLSYSVARGQWAFASYDEGAGWLNPDTSVRQTLGTTATAFAVQALPDGGLLAGYLSGALLRFTADGSELTRYESSWSNVQSIAFDAGTGLVAAGYFGGEVGIWKLDGTPVATMEPYFPSMEPLRIGAARAVQFIAGQILVSGHDDGHLLVIGLDGKIIQKWQAHDGAGAANTIWDVAVSPNQELIATAGYDGLVNVWETPVRRNARIGTPIKIAKGNRSWATAVRFRSDRELIVGGSDGSLRQYQLDATDPLVYGQKVYYVAQHRRDGSLIANGSSAQLSVYRDGRETPLPTPDDSSTVVVDLALDAEGKRTVALTHDRKLLVWGPQDQLLGSITLPEALSPQQVCLLELDQVLVGSRDGSIVRIDIPGGASQAFAKLNSEINDLGCAGNRIVATAGPYHQVGEERQQFVLFDGAGRELKRIEGQGEQITAAVPWSGRFLIAQNGLDLNESLQASRVTTRLGQSVTLLDQQGTAEQVYADHPERVRTLSAHAGYGYLAVGYGIANTSGNDGVRLWDLASAEILADMPLSSPPLAVSISPDGETIVVAEQNRLSAWPTPHGISRAYRASNWQRLNAEELAALSESGTLGTGRR